MSHGKFASQMITLALLACLLPLVGCDGGAPKRRGPQNYREYRAAHDPRYRGDKGTEGAGFSSDDGEFGPASGDMAVLSADAIAGGGIANSGAVKGLIKYAGKAAKTKLINTSKTPFCVQSGELRTEDLLVSNAGGLKNVVVYVSKGFNRFTFEPYSKSQLVDQNGCRYVPHVVAAMTGQELQVRNSDNTSHNYHFTGLGNPEINNTQPGPQSDSEFLAQPELGASFSCDIHPWMRAPVFILTHPFYAVTSEDGSFEIKNLPPGTYEISFAHERADMKTTPQTIVVEAGKVASINAEFRR